MQVKIQMKWCEYNAVISKLYIFQMEFKSKKNVQWNTVQCDQIKYCILVSYINKYVDCKQMYAQDLLCNIHISVSSVCRSRCEYLNG